MKHDTMSVDEWLQAFFMAATCDGATFVGNEEVGIDEIKRELRRGVIREASVGNVVISTDDIHETHFAAYSRDCGLIGDCGVADGDYDLIPKETP